MRVIIFASLFLCTTFAFSQKKYKKRAQYKTVRAYELDMTVYEKDSAANAVYLYEHGENYFEEEHGRIFIIKKYFAKLKILTKEGLSYATVTIPLYHSEKNAEKVSDIIAATHNPDEILNLNPRNIYTDDINENWKVKKFTFPGATVGSVLTYEYTIKTPYLFNMEGWDFQADIPKVYSEFNAKIPGNYIYNRTLRGYLKLAVNESKIEKQCFDPDGYYNAADCETIKYAMKDIPAFEVEDYMLSKYNYYSKLKFELSVFNGFDGTKHRYTKSWKDVDKEFRKDKDIGIQVRKKGYFQKLLPEDILQIEDEVARAKAVYSFIQNHFNWNKKFGLFKNARVKTAYQNKTGNVAEVNLSLVNALQAAGLDAKMMLISTRKNGLPTLKHPVITDFNYLIAKLIINNESYYLDATDKDIPFNILPFRALNYTGRVMNFKEESYWDPIPPNPSNIKNVVVQLNIDETGAIAGKMSETNTGYLAIKRRKLLNEVSEESYLDMMESRIQDVEIDDYIIKRKDEIDKSISEQFDFNISKDFTADKIYFDPFLIKQNANNPFKLKTRSYPVDFGYPSQYRYRLIMKLPNDYEIVNLPENKAIKIGDKAYSQLSTSVGEDNTITLIFSLSLKGHRFVAEEYDLLKKLFNYVADTQNNTILNITKKNH